jgi:hypothetical protein
MLLVSSSRVFCCAVYRHATFALHLPYPKPDPFAALPLFALDYRRPTSELFRNMPPDPKVASAEPSGDCCRGFASMYSKKMPISLPKLRGEE